MTDRKKITTEINGVKHEAIATRGDYLAILGLFFYTQEERKEIVSRGTGFADTQLRKRLEDLVQLETERFKVEAGDMPEDQFNKELNDRIARQIGTTALVRIELEYETRLSTAQRLHEIFPDAKEIWHRTNGDVGLRLTPDEVCNIAVEIFKAFPVEEALEVALQEKAIAPTPQKNEVAELIEEIREDLEVENHIPQVSQAAEAIIMGDEKAADAATLVELSDQKTLSERLRAAGVGDDVIARVIDAEAEVGAMG